jgi:hypothetical protein
MSWWLLTGVPSIFKVIVLSVFLVLLVSNLTISQMVLFLFRDLLILSANLSFLASLTTADKILQYFLY